MDYSILNRKPKINLINKDEQSLDLLARVSDYNLKGLKLKGNYVYVNEHYVARPDLVSLAFYKTDSFADMICKINDISNPFELNEGMTIFVPDYYSALAMINVIEHVPCEQVSKNPNETLQQQNLGRQKLVNESRSPNEQTVGETQYIYDESLGMLIY